MSCSLPQRQSRTYRLRDPLTSPAFKIGLNGRITRCRLCMFNFSVKGLSASRNGRNYRNAEASARSVNGLWCKKSGKCSSNGFKQRSSEEG
ncbi:unnamed protein product, partial [Nesidiocoris tenuis]